MRKLLSITPAESPINIIYKSRTTSCIKKKHRWSSSLASFNLHTPTHIHFPGWTRTPPVIHIYGSTGLREGLLKWPHTCNRRSTTILWPENSYVFSTHIWRVTHFTLTTRIPDFMHHHFFHNYFFLLALSLLLLTCSPLLLSFSLLFLSPSL